MFYHVNRDQHQSAGARRIWLGVLSGVCVLLLLACAETTLTPSPGIWMSPPPVTSAALQPTIEALQVERYARAIEAEQQQAAAQATLALFYAEQTATAESVQVTATARAWEATATAWQTTVEAGQVYATQTMVAHQLQATATAQVAATLTAQYQAREAATATVEAILFQQRATETAVMWAAEATATAQVRAAQATIQAAEVRRVELATQRETVINSVKAWAPLGVSGVLLLVLVWTFIEVIKTENVRRRVVERDARGDAPLVFIPRPGGGVAWYDPDRSFGPLLEVDAGGQARQPQLAAPEYQERVTGRDQLHN